MEKTIKRTSFCLTKRATKELDELSIYFEENKSQVISRALCVLRTLQAVKILRRDLKDVLLKNDM
jgi:hypothetical protein